MQVVQRMLLSKHIAFHFIKKIKKINVNVSGLPDLKSVMTML